MSIRRRIADPATWAARRPDVSAMNSRSLFKVRIKLPLRRRTALSGMRTLAATLAAAAALALTAETADPAAAAPISYAAVTHAAPVTHALTATTLSPCPAGYAHWHITWSGSDQWLYDYGPGNAVETNQSAATCWHAPASGNWGTFTDPSGNCLDYYDNYIVVLAKADCGAVAAQWFALSLNGGAVDFLNKYALNHNLVDEYMGAQSDPPDITVLAVLSPYPNGTLSRWFIG
jgi:hypothetical protein